jgi:hypothetical protein
MINTLISYVNPDLVGLAGTKMISQLGSGFLAGVFGAAINTPGSYVPYVILVYRIIYHILYMLFYCI